jgi:hypothetical protein
MQRFLISKIFLLGLLCTLSGVGPVNAVDNCIVSQSGVSYSTPIDTGSECIIKFISGSAGTWKVPDYVSEVRLLLVGGGGGGGSFGGGGAGAFYDSADFSISVSAGSDVPITVGSGGTGKRQSLNTDTTDSGWASYIESQNGGDSIFGNYTAGGGGGGGHVLGMLYSHYKSYSGALGRFGASGGGGGGSTRFDQSHPSAGSVSGGVGESTAASIFKRNSGGSGRYSNTAGIVIGGGGGGAGATGADYNLLAGGQGGSGLTSNITGSDLMYAAGGGGGGNGAGTSDGSGGSSVGGNAGNSPTSGSANTGSGGGASGSTGITPANGAAGVVIIRYSHANATTKRLAAEKSANDAAAKAAAEAAAAKREAERKHARNQLTATKIDPEKINLELLNQADLGIVSERQSSSVISEILKLDETVRSNIESISKIVVKYRIVDRVRDSNQANASSLLAHELVTLGVIDSESKNKSSITAAIRKLPEESKMNLELVQKAVQKELVAISERSAKLQKALNKVRK